MPGQDGKPGEQGIQGIQGIPGPIGPTGDKGLTVCSFRLQVFLYASKIVQFRAKLERMENQERRALQALEGTLERMGNQAFKVLQDLQGMTAKGVRLEWQDPEASK